jgi:glycosyltransferase involved in cell wall biosynthesis
VILAIRNEAAFIQRTLTAILQQDYPHSLMELLIADGQSTDATRETICEVVNRHPQALPVKVIDNPGRIVSPGLNAALAAACGEVIVRIDGHTIIEPGYVRECVEALKRSGADNVGGRMDPVGTSLFGKAVALATSSPFGVGGARFHYSNREEWVDTVYLGCWPRAVFEAIGCFDEEQVRNQDDEFNYRLREAGGRVLLSPAIRSQYFNRGTLKSLWRQYFEYGLWKIRVMQKHPQQMQWRQFVPATFVLGLLMLAIAAVFLPAARLLLLSVLVLYVSAALFAAFRVSSKAQPLIPLVALVFAVLHVSYGSGFLRGLVRFWNRWGSDPKLSIPKLGSLN